MGVLGEHPLLRSWPPPRVMVRSSRLDIAEIGRFRLSAGILKWCSIALQHHLWDASDTLAGSGRTSDAFERILQKFSVRTKPYPPERFRTLAPRTASEKSKFFQTVVMADLHRSGVKESFVDLITDFGESTNCRRAMSIRHVRRAKAVRPRTTQPKGARPAVTARRPITGNVTLGLHRLMADERRDCSSADPWPHRPK